MHQCPHMLYACPHYNREECEAARDCLYIAQTVGAATAIATTSAFLARAEGSQLEADLCRAKALLKSRMETKNETENDTG